MRISRGVSLKKRTSLKIGGLADYFVRVATEQELVRALKFARLRKLKWYLIGAGSNLVAGDGGFSGLIIENAIEKFARNNSEVSVGAGNNLLRLVYKLDRLGLGGLERMAGIPGTVGGAVYGSAGAYGQEIRERVAKVRYMDGKSNKFKWLSNRQCEFSYRHSIFKRKKHWIITEVRLKLARGRGLARISDDIVKLRLKKYRKGLKCPGSFFKNIKLDELNKSERKILLSRVDRQKIIYGKVPVGYLLEEAGAKGLRQGSVRVARHHGNLIYNANGAKASDVKKLAKRLKVKVKKKFGIMLEEEVQYL